MNWKRAWKKRLRKIKTFKLDKVTFVTNSGRNRKKRLISRFTQAKLLSIFAVLAFFAVLGSIFFGAILFAWYAKDLPHPDKIVRQEGFSTRIYSRSNEILYDVFAEQKRIPVKLNQVPGYLKQATIAIEDKNFYEHQGFDPLGMSRAVYNIVVHRRLQGGSTLTQQLVKNVLLTKKRILSRKIKEFILAVQIENRYSKDDILQMYLNEAPYGGTAWGVGTAAETYFNRPVADLDLVESAILAGLPQRPSFYSPFGQNPKAYIGRTKAVLRRMREDGYITRAKEKEAIDRLPEIKFAQQKTDIKAPHFVFYVKQLLEERYGQQMVEKGGLQVYTTLDWGLQQETQQIVTEEIEKVEHLQITNGAAVVLNPQTGEVLAMVGSKDYFDPDYDGQVNVTLSLRQPGSAIKPVTYVTAFGKGYTPATLLMDTSTEFPITGQPDYAPVNYDGKFHGPLQVRFALGSSINVVAVKMLAKVGIESMLSTAYDLGLSTLKPSKDNLKRLGLSVTLGGGEVRLLELAEAYSSFANGGLKVEPVSILKIVDREGNILEKNEPRTLGRVLSEGEAFLINHILSDNNARLLTFGQNSAINITGQQVAVKTGTTNDKRDNWTIGWTPEIITGVWVGNNDNSPMKQVASGVSGAAPIWRRIILKALEDKPKTSFSPPDNVITAEVDRVSGYRAHNGFPSRMEYFVKNTQPVGEDPVHKMLKLCRGEDKLATSVDIARGHYREKEFFVFKENDPVSEDGRNRWQEGIDNWLEGQPDPRYHPPTEYCSSQNEIEINFVKPADRIQVDTNEVEVKAKAISEHKVDKIELYINGILRESFSGPAFDKIYTLEDGTYHLKIEAEDDQGNRGSKDVWIGVNVPWDWEAEPTATPTQTMTPTPSLQVTPTPTKIAVSSPTPTPTIFLPTDTPSPTLIPTESAEPTITATPTS